MTSNARLKEEYMSVVQLIPSLRRVARAVKSTLRYSQVELMLHAISQEAKLLKVVEKAARQWLAMWLALL